MIALYILLGILALLCLLLSSPVTLKVHYREELSLLLRVWGLPFPLLPRRKKDKKAVKTAANADTIGEKKEKPSFLSELHATFREDGLGATLHFLGLLAGLLKKAVGRLFRSLTVKDFTLEMRVSGEDAAAAAVNYGKVCAVAYPALGIVESAIPFERQNVRLEPDFHGAGNAVLLDATVGVSLWKLLLAAVGLLFGFLKIYMTKDTGKDENNGGK